MRLMSVAAAPAATARQARKPSEETDALEHGDGAGGDGETESHGQDESGDERDDSLNGAHVENPF